MRWDRPPIPGSRHSPCRFRPCRSGRNSIADFIPVARIADMLLHPGEPFDYNGQRLTYPDIKLVYWAGGNPFHHHQDLNRLRDAFARPDTVIVHEFGMDRERAARRYRVAGDHHLGARGHRRLAGDPLLVAMHRAVPPYRRGARRLRHLCRAGAASRRSPSLYRGPFGAASGCGISTSRPAARCGSAAPRRPISTNSGKRASWFCRCLPWDGGIVRAFRRDPEAAPLPTPSGKIEIASAKIAGFGYPDCPGHPTWLPPDEARLAAGGALPAAAVANQPATRLHSQLDFGATSLASKIKGREPVRIHPQDAAARGIGDGDIVRLYNDRGACLAGAVLSDALRPGVVQLSTGAWYDPEDPTADNPLCVHGNPNVLTRDAGTSRLAQGCTGQLTPRRDRALRGPFAAGKGLRPARSRVERVGGVRERAGSATATWGTARNRGLPNTASSHARSPVLPDERPAPIPQSGQTDQLAENFCVAVIHAAGHANHARLGSRIGDRLRMFEYTGMCHEPEECQ